MAVIIGIEKLNVYLVDIILKIMKAVFLFLFFIYTSQTFAQLYEGTRASVEMVNETRSLVKASTKNAIVIYGTNTNELTVKINLADVITGIKVIDSTLQTLPVSYLIFKGYPNITIDQLNDENNNKSFKIEGQVSFKDIQQTFLGAFSFINLGDRADLKTTKINFEVRLNPNAFSLPVIADLCNYELNIKIDEGKINVVTH